ncbi:MAG: hypothetical protein KDA83_20895, partial [Planctomycetales bacterium]|nr:hypothetical protein [Planctomycetales bacterium]
MTARPHQHASPLFSRLGVRRRWVYLCGLVWSYGLLAALLTGCRVGPDFSRPALPIPDQWQSDSELVGVGSTVESHELAWWQALNSPQLDHIVANLETQNYSLWEAAERINEARAQRRATQTQRFPTFSSDAA